MLLNEMTQDEDSASIRGVDGLYLLHLGFDHLSESDRNAFCSKCCFFNETYPHL